MRRALSTHKVRRIVRNGNSTHVSLPQQVLDQLRWSPGDSVVVEVVDVDALRVRLARVSDFRAPGMPVPVTSPLEKVGA